MNFSYEEIYYMYGQYDKFVNIEFHKNSEAFNKFGESLMGVFKYTVEERLELENILKTDNIPRTNKRICFEPSELIHLTVEQIVDLDKIGLLNGDFDCISTSNWRNNINSFIINEEKEIPVSIKVNVDLSDVDEDLFTLGFLKSRIKDGGKLAPCEVSEYYALRLLYEPDTLKKNDYSKHIINKSTGKIKDQVAYYYYYAKFLKGKIDEHEKIEFELILKNIASERIEILNAELQKSQMKLKEIALKHKDTFHSIMSICINFKDELIYPLDNPIWWDFERFIHIYLRHVKETQLNEYHETKTLFQYKFHDIKQLITSVIGIAQKDIESHFETNRDKVFKRLGKRSIYYNGNYYRLEIEPNGRILTFHALNDMRK